MPLSGAGTNWSCERIELPAGTDLEWLRNWIFGYSRRPLKYLPGKLRTILGKLSCSRFSVTHFAVGSQHDTESWLDEAPQRSPCRR